MSFADTRTFQVIAAVTPSLGIGKNGVLPAWQLPGDVAHFREMTTRTQDASRKNVIIMGRRTYFSIPEQRRPLKGRLSMVISSTPQLVPANETCLGTYSSLDTALKALEEDPVMLDRIHDVYVIGGAQLYATALKHPQCQAVHITRIEQEFDCDTFMPALDPAVYGLWSAGEPIVENGTRYSFLCYTRFHQGSQYVPSSTVPRHDEMQYLEIVRDLISTGTYRSDRTGTGTLSKFGRMAKYNLRHTFPLLTTKRVFWRGVAEELLWFIRGSTNANVLRDKGIHIWDGNSSREFLDARGLQSRQVGDLGPVYGFQWRHFGATYTDMSADYSGQGVDQLRAIIEQLRKDPYDRRMIMTAWNPAALHEMALPPCHLLCQFYVANGELNCLMVQRSCDVGLGVPFNIASYALLTRLVAHVTNLLPGDFIHVMGDTHVYMTHVEPLKEQLKNAPRHFPTLHINSTKKEIDEFVFEDFELRNYRPHASIKMDMAV